MASTHSPAAATEPDEDAIRENQLQYGRFNAEELNDKYVTYPRKLEAKN